MNISFEGRMNAIHRKTVYTDKRVPHFADNPVEATHRYMNAAGTKWKYMIARTDREFLAWGEGWIEGRTPQTKRGGVWRSTR